MTLVGLVCMVGVVNSISARGYERGSFISHPFKEIMTDRQTNQPTDEQPSNREVIFPIAGKVWLSYRP